MITCKSVGGKRRHNNQLKLVVPQVPVPAEPKFRRLALGRQQRPDPFGVVAAVPRGGRGGASSHGAAQLDGVPHAAPRLGGLVLPLDRAPVHQVL